MSDDTDLSRSILFLSTLAACDRLVRFVPDAGQKGLWLLWTGTRWRWDTTGEIDTWGREMAIASSDAGQVAAIRQASKDAAVRAPLDDLDTHPHLVTCADATVDLRTGAARPPSHQDLITRAVPGRWDPAATAPRWLACVERAFPDPDVRDYVQKIAGYALSGSRAAKRMMFPITGPGDAGKSSFVSGLLMAAGDYGAVVSPDLFMLRGGSGHDANSASPELAKLRGARLVVTSETSAGQYLDGNLLKRLVGGGKITARGLWEKPVEFAPAFKIFMDVNEMPVISDTSDAIYNRIRPLPFTTVPIPASEQVGLEAIQQWWAEEADGILQWIVAGAVSFFQNPNAPEPLAVQLDTEALRSDNDNVSHWLDECGVVGEGVEGKASHLYGSYEQWSKANGYRPLGGRSFGLRLTSLGYAGTHRRDGTYRQGITLRTAHTASANPLT